MMHLLMTRLLQSMPKERPAGVLQYSIVYWEECDRKRLSVLSAKDNVVAFTTVLLTPLLPSCVYINPLNPELNPICYLLALLAHHFLHVSRIRVKSLTIRLLMSYIYIYIYIYIYGAPILDVSRSHTTTQHSR